MNVGSSRMDTSQYLEIFLDETKEHLQNLNTQILELESDPENMDNINEIFRAAHSLKGMLEPWDISVCRILRMIWRMCLRSQKWHN